MSSDKPSLVFRFRYFLLLAFFASIPLYIVTGFFINVILSGESLSLAGLNQENLKDVAIVLATICTAIYLTYFLWLLAFRALTWRSSREDGNLLPPKVMKIFFVMFGALGLGALVYSLYQGEHAISVGALFYLFTALAANRRVRNA